MQPVDAYAENHAERGVEIFAGWWHRECLRCSQCDTSLISGQLHSNDGVTPHCVSCYEDLYMPKCARCQSVLREGGISAMDKSWHNKCFRCEMCSDPIGRATYKCVGEKAYCLECHVAHILPKCQLCVQPLVGGVFGDVEGDTYCQECYVENIVPKCWACKKPAMEVRDRQGLPSMLLCCCRYRSQCSPVLQLNLYHAT